MQVYAKMNAHQNNHYVVNQNQIMMKLSKLSLESIKFVVLNFLFLLKNVHIWIIILFLKNDRYQRRIQIIYNMTQFGVTKFQN